MKLKIEKAFNDKYTDAKYAIGEVVDFAEDRAKELLADGRNLVSKAEEAFEQIVEPVTHKRGKKSK